MQLMRFEPFREADEFFRAMTSPALHRWPSIFGENGDSRHEWLPAVDIRETDREYLVNADLPGIRREDVKVKLEDNVLTVEGERKQEKEAKGERAYRIERVYGSFLRRFTLPEDADPTSIRAECKDGVLCVHVPKRQVPKHKALEISVQ